MKKLILILAICSFSPFLFAQTTAYIYATGASGSYISGSATSTTRSDDSIRSTSTTERGYAVFDLSSIPAGSIISGCALVFNVSSFTPGIAGLCNTYGFAGDLSAVTSSATLFSDITSGTLLFSATPPAIGSYGTGVGHDSMSFFSATVDTFLQANIGGKVSIGFTGGGTNAYTIEGETAGGDAPRLEVHYAPSSYHIIADSAISPLVGSCDLPQFFIEADGISPLLAVKTYYGDGTSDSVGLGYYSASTSVAYPYHSYNTSGIYTIKQVLYYANAPQDSNTYNYTYTLCKSVFVNIYVDLNGDCVKGDSEQYNACPIMIKVDSAGIPVDTLSVTSGIHYSMLGPTGTIYSFIVMSSSLHVSCPTSGILYDTSGYYSDKQIGLSPSCTGSIFPDLFVYDVIPVTGENDQCGHIYAGNNLCTPTDAIVTLHYSPKYSVDMGGGILDVSRTPTSYTSSSVIWNLTGLSAATGPVDLFYAIWGGLTGHLFTPGDTIHSYVTITPTSGDVDVTNNSEIILDTVKAGCDPNEMSVNPAGCIYSNVSTQLQYTIHFMNVGNDTAFNIHVMDTLSDNVDPKSLRIVMASNTMNIALFNDGAHNIVKFDFPQINLLDSAACPQCSGAVIFSINTKPGLPDGATVFNHAGVFFDYNPVVMTNTVENVTGCAVASVKNETPLRNISIFPNPTTDELTIKMDQGSYNAVTITNDIGQEILIQPLTLSQTKVNLSQLPSGMYYVTFRGDNGTTVQKFVKM